MNYYFAARGTSVFASLEFYLFSDKPGVTGSDVTSIPLLFIDTAGMDISELVVSDEESKGNEG